MQELGYCRSGLTSLLRIQPRDGVKRLAKDMVRIRFMQLKEKRAIREDKAEVPGASTVPKPGAKSSGGSKNADDNAAHIVQTMELRKEGGTVSAWISVLLDWTDRFVKGHCSRKRV